MGRLFTEPAPFCAAALDALDIWELMGFELRLEALPVILAAYPDCDANEMIELLKVINRALEVKREA